MVLHFGGRRQFQISLNNVSNNETILVSQNLKKILLKLFSDVRSGMKDLSLDDIKEILRIEVRKSILHSGHVSEGHNEIFDSMKKIESLEKVYSREIQMRKPLVTDPKEISDPIDKKLRFENQVELGKKGDEESMMLDMDYIRALEHGMPPTAGLGIGIDRLAMLMTGSKSIQDVMLINYEEQDLNKKEISALYKKRIHILFNFHFTNWMFFNPSKYFK